MAVPTTMETVLILKIFVRSRERPQMAFNSRPTMLSSRDIRYSWKIQRAKPFNLQRTTPWIAGIGPFSTIRRSPRR